MSTVLEPGRWIARVRRSWRRETLLRGLLRSVAAAAGVASFLILLDQLAGLPPPARALLRFFVPAVLLIVLVPAFVRVLRPVDDRRFALLAEERDPALGHLLSTAVSATGDGLPARLFRARLAASLASARPRGRPAAGSALLAALAGLAVLLACFALVPGGAAEVGARWLRLVADPATGIAVPAGALGRTAEDAVRELRDVRVVVEPPAYVGGPASERDASLVTALEGSTLRVSGVAPANTEIGARVLGGGALTVTRSDRFAIEHRLSASDRGIEIVLTAGRDTLTRRVLPITVTRDAAPVVELLEPGADLVLATAAGTVPILARASDDHGIAGFRLAWILSRGSGESFSFTDGGATWDTVAEEEGGRTGRFTLDVARIGLQPGDVLHVRAVATDANDVTGPGEGVSATRLIRIAREGEEDQATTLIGFPLEAEKDPILSQRMIVLLTERLIARMPSLSADAVQTEAGDIARQQSRLRERLADIIYARTTGEEHAETHGPDVTKPIVTALDSLPPEQRAERIREMLEAASAATGQGTLEELSHDHDPDPALMVNLPLVPAFNAMYEAERWLRQGDPRTALPHEVRALEIIQRVREAERVYLRGRQTVAPVDVAAARGAGKITDADPAPRSAARTAPSPDAWVPKLTELSAQLPELEGHEAALRLSTLSAQLLEDPGIDAEAGADLARAATAARAGERETAHALLVHARGLLAPPAGSSGMAPASPSSPAAARWVADDSLRSPPAAGEAPFVFATARYASGDWDSGQLVPANLIHSLALYTSIPVAPEGVVVDLDSPEVFRYPFLFLTGHLPVRFTAAEAANLRAYVDRGGFVFIDDHNHDIDGAFHRTVTAELERVFGPGSLRKLPKDHELYRSFFAFEDGPPTTSHELNGWGDGLIHEELYGVLRPDGRVGVLYSNKDYASEWSYHVQNKRFLSLDNTRFGVNVLVYALTR